MDNIKLVEEVEYTGKFKIGSKVKVIGTTDKEDKRVLKLFGAIGVADKVDDINFISNYPYRVYFKEVTEVCWFNEAELELVTEQSTDTDSLKLRTFEILSKSSDVKFIEKELRGYAEWAVNNYKYDKAVEIYELIKEWKKLS